MSNKEIYQKTLVFSLRRALWDIIAFAILGGACALGYMIAEKSFNRGLVGLAIGGVGGLIAIAIILRFVGYTCKAGQIAMMTRAITEGSLPQDVYAEGKRTVKQRFLTVAAYFSVTGVIKGIFSQLGRGVAGIGKSIGGDAGETVGNVINSVIQVIVSYLSDCCLGWVFYRSTVNAAKATCEGAVLFFRKWKTLAKNMGRVFGMGIASFAVIGGAFTGIFYLILSRFPEVFRMLSEEIVEAAQRAEKTIPSFMSDPVMLTVLCSLVIAAVLWSILHSVFVRPYVLVGVLRNYLESGMSDIPDESSFSELDKMSDKFKKLHQDVA